MSEWEGGDEGGDGGGTWTYVTRTVVLIGVLSRRGDFQPKSVWWGPCLQAINYPNTLLARGSNPKSSPQNLRLAGNPKRESFTSSPPTSLGRIIIEEKKRKFRIHRSWVVVVVVSVTVRIFPIDRSALASPPHNT